MSGTYTFTVLNHRSNVLEVLKVFRVHRTKLNDFITNPETLLKEKNNSLLSLEQKQVCFN